MLKQQEGDQQLLQNDDSLTERRDDLETTRKSETRPRDDKNNLPGELTDPKTQILPYVIHDGGAYQLPVLLSSKDRDDLLRGAFWRPSGKVLTEKLALLSPAEVQTIRNILRKNQTHPYNLSHLAVVKTSRLKFWQKQKRVMVAFIEGEQSDISSDLLTTTELIPGNADAKYMPADSVPRGQVIEKTLTDVAQFPQVSNHIGPSAPHIHSSQSPVEYIETSRNRPEQAGLRPHTDAGSLSNRLELVQRSDKQGEGEGRGLPLYQDITQLLGSEDSHHAIPQKYRVWTVQPYKIPGKGQASPSDWTRCILSEEFLNAVLIEQKLQIIEKKDSRTALQKMATLPTHQQLQISRSIEAVRRSDSDSNFQWSLRQLEIIQSKGVFRAKRIKAIIVYAYGKPFMEMGPTRPQEDENRDTWLPGHISGPYSRPNIEAENYTSKRPSSILAPVSHRKDEERQKTHSISDKSNATAERSDTAERYDTDEERKRARRLRFSAKEQEVNQRILPARLLHQAEEANRRIANRTPMPRPVKISSPLSSMNDKLTGSSKMLSPQSSVAVRKRMFRPDTDVSSSSGEESSQPSERFIMSSRRLEDVPMSRPSRLKPRTVEPKQDAGQLALRWYDRRPSSRSHSTRRQRDEPGLLHWHDDNGLGARILYPLRESYPAHFDRQPYNPQPLVQKAVEQLLLEWTPVQENQDNPENDVADETMPEDSEADSEQFILANEHPTENRVPQQTAVSNDGLRDFVSGIKRRATEDGVDFAPEYWVTRYGPMSASPQPINRLPRQSTADSNTFPKQLETNTHRNVQGKLAESEAKAGIDLGTTPKVKGSTTIPRASTVPLPERQAWSNVNWAKQIVEETAMAPEDQDNPILPRRQSRQLSTEETLIERGLSGRWRDEAEFFPRTAPSRRRTRDRAKDTLRRERSFERVPEPPMRYAAELDEKPDRRGTLRNQLYSIDQNDSSYRSTAGNNDERRHSRSTRKDSRVLDR
ncbi:hypothetical protein F5Y19DRAFT_177442 [Xylariaceae sp. FL1651]|nr:hypothetical protein F5Y19DRAFT_177442 [Xylariaceae sp. FL1651]